MSQLTGTYIKDEENKRNVTSCLWSRETQNTTDVTKINTTKSTIKNTALAYT